MPLRLVKRKGSPHWYMRGTVRGQGVFETTGTDDEEAADAVRIEHEAKLLRRSIFGASAAVTFEEAAVSYLAAGGDPTYLGTEDRDTGKWSLLIGHFMGVVIGTIGQDEADEAASALYPGTKPSTRLRCCYVPLRAVLRHAAKKKWCPVPAIETPELGEVVTKFSSHERLEKLLPHCSPKMRRFVMVDAYTGARLSEILRINWDKDVILARRTIMLWTTKEKQRAVYIPDPLLIELSTVPEEKRHGPMFDWSHKSHVHKPLKNACKRAGVEYLPPHQQGRHTYAQWMVDFGELSLKELMEAGGWSSVNSVVRYLHVTPGKAAKRADRFPMLQNPCTENVKPVKDRRKRVKSA